VERDGDLAEPLFLVFACIVFGIWLQDGAVMGIAGYFALRWWAVHTFDASEDDEG
jgi:hypothetical protein